MSVAELRRGIRVLCETADHAAVLGDDGDVRDGRGFVALLHRKPEIFRPMCLSIAYVGRPTVPQLEPYLGDRGWRAFGEAFCRFTPFYVRADGRIDFEPLMRQHTAIAKALMVAAFMLEYDNHPHRVSYSRREYQRRAGRFCTEAFRRGFIVYHGVANFEIRRERRYYALHRSSFA